MKQHLKGRITDGKFCNFQNWLMKHREKIVTQGFINEQEEGEKNMVDIEHRIKLGNNEKSGR